MRNILCNRCNTNDRVDNTSGVPNICWHKLNKKWRYIKIINGKSLITILGITILVRARGVKRLTSKFLKNSISSNKFNIKPKQ